MNRLLTERIDGATIYDPILSGNIRGLDFKQNSLTSFTPILGLPILNGTTVRGIRGIDPIYLTLEDEGILVRLNTNELYVKQHNSQSTI